MTSPAPQPGILDIAAYVGGESAVAGADKVIKLSSNEGALGPGEAAQAAFAAIAADLHRYPDGSATALRDAIAEAHGVDAARVVCGAGSDEIISLLCQAYAGPGDEVLHSAHGFLMYAISAKAAGATPVSAPETDLTADVDALLARVSDRTRLLFLANPNNPTGTLVAPAELHRLRADLRDDILLVVDAAYAEFLEPDADYESGQAMVDAGDNVVMTRTFSKIYGLGGLRLGWGYCPPAVADVLNRVRGPFNVGAAALAAGVAAVGDAAFIKKSRDHNTRWREWTRDRLLALGLNIPPSAGNFLLVCFGGIKGRDAEAADGFLKQRGIIVRGMAGYGLPDCLRISIGLEDEMRAVVDALGAFMGRNEDAGA